MTRHNPRQTLTTASLIGDLGDPVRRTTQAVVAERLRIEILSGVLPPGSRLRQAEVAQRMNTSTTPVREALRELASEGLLDVDPHRGVIVHEPSIEELAEIYEIRQLLEPACISKTVKSISDDEIEQARALAAQMEANEDPGAWTLYNNRFHGVLARASGSLLLASMVQNLRDRSSQYVADSMRLATNRIADANREHAALLQACIDRDVEVAIAVIRQHLDATVDHGATHLGGGLD